MELATIYQTQPRHAVLGQVLCQLILDMVEPTMTRPSQLGLPEFRPKNDIWISQTHKAYSNK